MSYKINCSTEEKIKLAKDDSVEKLYERKNKRTFRVLTVLSYICLVSLAAIVLSLYYIFLWDPKTSLANSQNARSANCDKVIVIPENIAIQLANNSVLSVDDFYHNIYLHLEKHKNFPKISQANVKSKQEKLKSKKKLTDDEDINSDMESSGDKEQITTYSPPFVSSSDPDLNDTTIIFDQYSID